MELEINISVHVATNRNHGMRSFVLLEITDRISFWQPMLILTIYARRGFASSYSKRNGWHFMDGNNDFCQVSSKESILNVLIYITPPPYRSTAPSNPVTLPSTRRGVFIFCQLEPRANIDFKSIMNSGYEIVQAPRSLLIKNQYGPRPRLICLLEPDKINKKYILHTRIWTWMNILRET